MLHESMQTVKDSDGNYSSEKVCTILRQTNLAVTNQLLQTIGKNKLVQAFQDSIEVSHTHRLVEQLNERTKKVKTAAEARRLRLVKDNPDFI